MLSRGWLQKEVFVEDLTCPTCKAANAAGARFCSSCGAGLRAREVAPGPPPTRPDVGPPSWSQPVPPPAPPTPWTSEFSASGTELPGQGRARAPLWIALGAGAVVVAAVVAWVLFANRSGVGFPDSLAGQPRLTSETYESAANTIAKSASFAGEEPKVAIYGTAARPTLMVFAFDAPPPGDPSSFFDGFVGGFEGSSGATVDQSSVVIEPRGATTYYCGSYASAQAQGWVCVWLDDETFGVLVTLDPSIPGGVDLASEIHDAVVR